MPGPLRPPRRPLIPLTPAVVVTPPAQRQRPARPPVVVAPVALEPPIPREPPPGDSKQVVEWIVARIHDHETLRARSFWDTGHLIALLLERREAIGVRDIKELASKLDLGMSHMTAQKYLMVARTFERELAVETGIEKCYALTRYAKTIGRPGEASGILAANEPIRGVSGLRAQAASASKVYDAIKALKDEALTDRDPPEVQATRVRAAAGLQKVVRKLGLEGASTQLVRHDGQQKIAIYVSIETALALDSKVPRALARYGAQLARSSPEVAELFRAEGLVRRARAPART